MRLDGSHENGPQGAARVNAGRRVEDDDPLVETGAVSHVGGRDDNQDRCFAQGRLGVVSDGMGGYEGGGLAAEISVDAVRRHLAVLPVDGVDESSVVSYIEKAFSAANDDVRARRDQEPEHNQMGATLTVAVAVALGSEADESEWIVAHVGDSPAYLLTSERCVPLTVDHTVPAQMLNEGAITEEEADAHPYRHMLLRAIGAEPFVAVSITRTRLRAGDALVLVSDGLSGVLFPDDIWRLSAGATTAADIAEVLVAQAVALESSDNVTAVVLRHGVTPH